MTIAVGSSATVASTVDEGRWMESVPVVELPSAEQNIGPTDTSLPGRAATGESGTQAVPAAVIAAAGWCASGVLGSVSTQTLLDIYHGKASSKKTYVTNAVVGCIVGNFGSWAWRVLANYLKKKAINAVISFVIYVARS